MIDVDTLLTDCLIKDQFWLKKRYLNIIQQKECPQREMELLILHDDIVQSIKKCEARAGSLPKKIVYPDLPVVDEKQKIIAALETHPVVIIAGETGSGKTTQLPKICLEAGCGIKGMIGHTQPRRIAARAVAMRIASELETPLGSLVGFKVRFSDQTKEGTLIKLMTDGVLLSETHKDKWLSQYDCLIIDEAHERSLNIDFLLGYLKNLLQKRSDVKIVVTSATIDVGRFAEFFNQAPIIEVKGRTFPIEVNYLSQDAINDPNDDPLLRVVEAIETATERGPGDILVFQSGEKEIHEVMEVLRERKINATVFPLYARLSTSDQQKVFQSAPSRKIIVSTNVAETSLTVPNIRFVVDTGLARISRYNYRTKLQRLPIEPISQANADQRKGRCGRVGPGICYRLYTQEDFSTRPLYMEPEILRTNLAGVILKMLNLGIRNMDTFPFIDPPDSRYLKDGFTLLARIGAVQQNGTITPLGRMLVNIPIEPKLGRIILAANQYGVLKEILIIVSALTIVDPKERPLKKQAQADLAHQQFQDPHSDFMGYYHLWNFLVEHKKRLSHQQFRKLCRQNYLSFIRICEWFDVHEQLAEIAKELGFKQNQVPGVFAQIHKALLAGLVDSIGIKAEKGEYLGARHSKFFLHPSSGLFKKSAQWIMACEIIHTTKVYARVIANIEPEWVEEVAGHLLKRSYFEPHFEQKQGRIIAYEKAILLGLEVVSRRKISYETYNPIAARALFIQQGLVEGNVKTNCPFYEKNKATITAIEAVQHKIRKQNILVDDRLIYQFYDNRLPEHIYSVQALEAWLFDKADDFLVCTQEEISLSSSINQELPQRFPSYLIIDGTQFSLEYKFDPSSACDGVTVRVPLSTLKFIKDQDFSWLVPGFIEEKIATYMKALPKKLRAHLTPLPQYVHQVAQGINKEQRSLAQAIQHFLNTQLNIQMSLSVWENIELPAHLKMHFVVIDDNAVELARGDDVAVIYHDLKEAFVSERVGSALERTHLVQWEDDLPLEYQFKKNTLHCTYYPALVDHQQTVAIQLFESVGQADAHHRFGLARMYLFYLSDQLKFFKKNLKSTQKKTLAKLYLTFSDVEQLLDQLLLATSLQVFVRVDQRVREKVVFENILAQHRNQFIMPAQQLLNLVTQVLTSYHSVVAALQKQQSYAPLAVMQDIQQQLTTLFPKDFIVHTPCLWLKRFPVYLKGILMRLEKLLSEPQRDKDLMKEVLIVQKAYASKLSKTKGSYLDPDDPLQAFRWRIEELRISLFAQSLGAQEVVSRVRLLKLLEKLD